MPAETDLEKLIVRLTLDSSTYKTGVDEVVAGAMAWAKATGAIEEAQRLANKAKEEGAKQGKELGQVLKGVHSGFSSLASVVGMFNAQAGFAVHSILNVSTAAAGALGNLKSLGGVFSGLAGVMKANPAMFGVGIPAAIGAAVIGTAYQIGVAERDVVMQYSDRYYGQNVERRGYLRGREMFDVTRNPLLPPETGFGLGSMAITRERAKLEYEQRLQRIGGQREVETGHQMAAAAGASKELEALGGKDREFLNIKNIWGESPGSLLDRPIHKQALTQYRQDLAEASKALQGLNSEEEDLKKTQEELDNSLKATQMSNITQVVRSLGDQYAKLTMGEREFSTHMFAKQNELDLLPPDQAREKVLQYQKAWDTMFEQRTKHETRAVRNEGLTIAEGAQETLHPLDQDLRIRNEINQAQRAYFQEHLQHMPAMLASETELTAIKRQQGRLAQEGYQVFRQFMLPAARAELELGRLQQQFDAMREAGMPDDENMQWARLRATEAAYGGAHKDFSQYSLGQQYEAIQSNTSQYTRGLWEYTMGSTAIPLSQLGLADKGKKPLGDEELFGWGAETPKPVDDPQLMVLDAIKTGIDALVTQGKDRKNDGAEIRPANL